MDDIMDRIKELVINNSNLEGEADDSLLFTDVDNIEDASDGFRIVFKNGEKAYICHVKG